MISPLQVYQARLDRQEVSFDACQQPALVELERVHQSLLFPSLLPQSSPIQGVYLWGDVGRGKTFLMDLFYDCLPAGMGLRLHFHHFMARLHRELNLAFGQKNPLKGIAKRLAAECRVLCFDEFFVSDIGDAMLLGGLVEALFEEGVVLVATSNIAVENLFQNQLQKARFAPTIALLEAHLACVHLAGEEDHRLRHTGGSAIYFVTQEQAMLVLFTQLAQGDKHQRPLQVCRRAIKVIASADNIAWFDFYALCDGPRSSLDYIELAQTYPFIMVTGIPELSSEPFEHIKARGTEDGAIGSGQTGERAVSLGLNDDAVRRFISLVDECYDHQVVLLLSADVPLDNLYVNGALLFEFRRTYSRLIEMKSHYYQSLRASVVAKSGL
ncbi:cell division protein ZapE [Marinomonas sp. M1K-6]|uniref:Cell division protein ZapE n=1 Tax=Marinomonas profundi TaxID=2726122 RepID=A0A847R2H9_9GAMM|nr:cell division protein ZapE [Marinomonas profundi]NLQ18061.1 cell division protein ZapE [Marinomonas profundi]UDV04151.1 AFG1 family ATPase [Marinomonas profundi]